MVLWQANAWTASGDAPQRIANDPGQRLLATELARGSMTTRNPTL
jgi:hypothetical protein